MLDGLERRLEFESWAEEREQRTPLLRLAARAGSAEGADDRSAGDDERGAEQEARADELRAAEK